MQQAYRAESAALSPFWTLWAPLGTLAGLLALAYVAPGIYARHIQPEGFGLLEIAHVVLPAWVAVLGVMMLATPYMRADWLRVLWCAGLVVGGIYWAGEEASWGQHWFGWATPDGWQELNDQSETNLHNTSQLLDQLPRAILRAGIIGTGLIGPLFILYRPQWQPRRLLFSVVPLAGVPLAALVLAMEPLLYFKGWFQDLFDRSVFTIRAAEIDELYVAWYLVLYAIVLYRRATGTSPFAQGAAVPSAHGVTA